MRERGYAVGIGVVASLLIAAPSATAAQVASPDAVPNATKVRDYWTPERMREAEPLDLARPAPDLADAVDIRAAAGAGKPRSVRATPSDYSAVTIGNTRAEGNRTHGKIFGTFPGLGNFVCSGTAITSPNRSTVWTAGHCIWDSDINNFATNLVFVPGYIDGARPFGSWAAVDAYVPNNWVATDGTDYRDDVGALRTEVKLRSKTTREKRRCNRRFEDKPAKRRTCRRRKVRDKVAKRVGARGIAFNQDPNDFTYRAFGYPVNPAPRFDGEHLERCTSGFTGSDGSRPYPPPDPISISCDMQGGASGGGWVISGTRVNGNVSYGYPPDPFIFSPYFDSFTKGFYDALKSLP